MFGKNLTAETKLKISESLKGRTRTVETKAKLSVANGTTIFVYDSEGYLVNSFSSERMAGIFFNCSYTTIKKYSASGQLFQNKWILSPLKNK